MGKLKQFSISLLENKSVYLPGESISGQVVVDLAESMQMKALKLKFAGKADVRWTETRSTGKTTYTVTYHGHEDLFEQYIVLYGEGSNGTSDREQMSAGQHAFPFTFQLPSPLPSSFEGKIGHIRYYLKGTIVKPWKFDHNTKAVFTVLDNVDLNVLPNMISPSGCSDNKVLCCWCCKSGPIEVDCHLDRTGYVPGEFIIINATLNNSSSSKVESTSAELIQKVTYHATSKKRSISKTMAKIPGPGCNPRRTIEWKNEKIQIPPLPPSEANHCKIIDITYFVQFQAHLRTCAINLRANSPITIGTVPLRSLDIYANPPVTPSAPVAPVQPESQGHVGPGAPTQYSSLPPPPTYAKAVDGAADVKDKDDNEYTMGDTSYTPQYTYYNWNESAFTYN